MPHQIIDLKLVSPINFADADTANAYAAEVRALRARMIAEGTRYAVAPLIRVPTPNGWLESLAPIPPGTLDVCTLVRLINEGRVVEADLCAASDSTPPTAA